MERIGMIRLDRENLPIDLLGGLQRPAWWCWTAIANASGIVAIQDLSNCSLAS